MIQRTSNCTISYLQYEPSIKVSSASQVLQELEEAVGFPLADPPYNSYPMPPGIPEAIDGWLAQTPHLSAATVYDRETPQDRHRSGSPPTWPRGSPTRGKMDGPQPNNTVRQRLSTARTFTAWLVESGFLAVNRLTSRMAGEIAPHDLRCTAAGILHHTLTVDGAHLNDLLDIQRVLDHADPATTQRSYLDTSTPETTTRAGRTLRLTLLPAARGVGRRRRSHGCKNSSRRIQVQRNKKTERTRAVMLMPSSRCPFDLAVQSPCWRS